MVDSITERFSGRETSQQGVSGLAGLANTSPGIVETLISIVVIALAVMIFARSKR